VHCVLSANGQGIENDETVVGVAEEREQLKQSLRTEWAARHGQVVRGGF